MNFWSLIRSLLEVPSKVMAGAKIGDAQINVRNPMQVAKAEADVVRFARQLVRGGYDSYDDIISSVRDCAEDRLPQSFEAAKIVESEIRALKEDQLTWPVSTDFDRLQDAIFALERKGIVTRQHFTCCQTCGHAEIGDEIAKYEAAGRQAHGYAFFHQQATESAVEGGDINFAYGIVGDRHSAAEIAQQVADQIRAAGLRVDWNGKDTTCVMVGLDWKRRWTGNQVASQMSIPDPISNSAVNRSSANGTSS
jgi:hypothetical protein